MNKYEKERYENCVNYANTMMMMANILKERYGEENESYISHVKKGIESCKLAIQIEKKYYEDYTNVISMVA